MKGALQIAKVAGIPVRVHWTFGLLLLWVVYIAVSNNLGWKVTLLSVAIVSIVFLCVILHEYGHALTARRFGVNTRDIILSPIGGIARLEFIPEKPYQEILIAIAGPAVNLVIASVLLLFGMLVIPDQIDLASREFWRWSEPQSVLVMIAKINLILLVFNMTPAFPMDGGRVLRAVLAIPFSRVRATVYAGFLGQAIGLFLFAAGMVELIFGRSVYIRGVEVSDMVLSFIGVFVFLAARREIQSVRMKSLLRNTTAEDVMRSHFITRPASMLISELDIEVPQEEGILLMEQDDLVGVLFKEFAELSRETSVAGSTLRHYGSHLYEAVDSRASLSSVIDVFQQKGYRMCPVYGNGQLTGIITRADLARFVSGK